MRTRIFIFALSVIVGLIYVYPHIAFRLKLKGAYQGIPMMQIDDEDIYLSRMREIVEGHYLVGSPDFFEYKNELPLNPPTGEMIYALPAKAFGVSLVDILIFYKFLLPLILFLLVYALTRRLSGLGNSLLGFLSATSTALFVTLGYDLVDYRHLFGIAKGLSSPESFLLWSRPVNPIIGALLLFGFLILLYDLIREKSYSIRRIVACSFLLAFMMASYFFSWGVALAVSAALFIFLVLKKEYAGAKKIVLIVTAAVILSSPYWYMVYKASRSPWHESAKMLMGVFYTHSPIVNIFLVASLVLFALIFFIGGHKISRIEIRHLVAFSFIIGGIIAFNQQIFSGITIWPYHFVQYTIPLSALALVSVFCGSAKLKGRYRHAAMIVAIMISFSSLLYGIYVQSAVYRRYFAHYQDMQKYGYVFDWINNNAQKDSVILVNEPQEDLARLIPAFTHSNVYVSTNRFSLIPDSFSRFLHNYFVLLRVRGIKPENFDRYLNDNKDELVTYLGANWQTLLGTRNFPALKDEHLEKLMEEAPLRYLNFYKSDFLSELKKYRIDFILSKGPLKPEVLKQMPSSKLIFEYQGAFIYGF